MIKREVYKIPDLDLLERSDAPSAGKKQRSHQFSQFSTLLILFYSVFKSLYYYKSHSSYIKLHFIVY
jgi:hypothetical protein